MHLSAAPKGDELPLEGRLGRRHVQPLQGIVQHSVQHNVLLMPLPKDDNVTLLLEQ